MLAVEQVRCCAADGAGKAAGLPAPATQGQAASPSICRYQLISPAVRGLLLFYFFIIIIDDHYPGMPRFL